MKSTLASAHDSLEPAPPRQYATARHLVNLFRCVTPAAVLSVAGLLAGCSGPAPEPAATRAASGSAAKPATEQPAPATPYQLVASIREVMNSVVDPNIDV